MSPKRNDEIQEIISDLECLKSNSDYKRVAEINIEFFEAARSPLTYIWWLIFKAPQLRKKREEILELGDLPLPKWQKATHLQLIKLERLNFPGLLKPLKAAILDHLWQLEKTKSEPLVLLSIGSGTMELEKQVIEDLLKANFETPVIFLGVELSPHILETAFANLSTLTNKNLVKIKKIDNLDSQVLDELKSEAKNQKFLVALINTNALDLRNNLNANSVDLVYHSRLRHHLIPGERDKLDELATYLASKVIEFDDFCSPPVFVFPSVITWRWPVTLNGAILSYLRDPSKKEVLAQKKEGWKTKIYQLGYYLRSYE